jgi:hypothetical protein
MIARMKYGTIGKIMSAWTSPMTFAATYIQFILISSQKHWGKQCACEGSEFKHHTHLKDGCCHQYTPNNSYWSQETKDHYYCHQYSSNMKMAYFLRKDEWWESKKLSRIVLKLISLRDTSIPVHLCWHMDHLGRSQQLRDHCQSSQLST